MWMCAVKLCVEYLVCSEMKIKNWVFEFKNIFNWGTFYWWLFSPYFRKKMYKPVVDNTSTNKSENSWPFSSEQSPMSLVKLFSICSCGRNSRLKDVFNHFPKSLFFFECAHLVFLSLFIYNKQIRKNDYFQNY